MQSESIDYSSVEEEGMVEGLLAGTDGEADHEGEDTVLTANLIPELGQNDDNDENNHN